MKASNKFIESAPDFIEDSNAPWTDVVTEDFHVIVYRDKYPVVDGHLLFVPKFNTPGVFLNAMEDALNWGRKLVENNECQGFNIGLNYGEPAGQTISWPHIHLMPRSPGDCTGSHIGGVRNIIPEKGDYTKWK